MSDLKKTLGWGATVVGTAVPAATLQGGGVIICVVAIMWTIGGLKRARWVATLLVQQSTTLLPWPDRRRGVQSALCGLGCALLTWAAAVVQFTVGHPLARGAFVLFAALLSLTLAYSGTVLSAAASLPRIRDHLRVLRSATGAADQALKRSTPSYSQLAGGEELVFYELLMTAALVIVAALSLFVTIDTSDKQVEGGPTTSTTALVTTTTVEPQANTTILPTTTTLQQAGVATTVSGSGSGGEESAEEICGGDPFELVRQWLGDRDSADLVDAYAGFGALNAGCPTELIVHDEERVVIEMMLGSGQVGALVWSPTRSAVLLPSAAGVVVDAVAWPSVLWATGRLRAYTAAMHVVGVKGGMCRLFFRPDPDAAYLEVPPAATAQLLASLAPGEVPQTVVVRGDTYTVRVVSFPSMQYRNITVDGTQPSPGASARAVDPPDCPGLTQLEESVAALPPPG